MMLQRASETQRQASNPESSVWVSASAGSGKTKVLIDRVLSLMLAGNRPETILCLTFTKAAAAEMENRLYERLASWTLCSDETLASELAALLGREVMREDMQLAKQLFSMAIDTPGGLKIQTIHGFCQATLKRFPLEAGLSPHFNVIDDTKSLELLLEAQGALIQDEGLKDTLTHLGQVLSAQQFTKISQMIIDERSRFAGLPEDLLAQVKETFGLDPLQPVDDFLQAFFQALPKERVQSIIDVLKHGLKTDLARAADMERAVTANDALAYLDCFLTQSGEVRKRLITSKLNKDYPHILPELEDEAERCMRLNETLRTHRVAAHSYHLARFGKVLIAVFEEKKREIAALDYQDLILKTSSLLRQSSCSAWVLYKLDGGIDNILIDEAQDTSPEQWQVITALCEEFFADEDDERTLFVVGDDKQSIYSFQGADPQVFSQMQSHFHERSGEVKKNWKAVELDVSFRSTPEILRAVDGIFEEDQVRHGVSQTQVLHHPFRSESPGHVEVWPLVEPEEKESPEIWPLPEVGREQVPPATRLARLIAKQVSEWLRSGKVVKGRPIRPGDIMVLVRKRSGFVDQLIRALKKENVPVAGVDRMVLLDQLPVQDLLKLVELTLLPQDDLTLATVLKGPLVSMSEEDLFALAHRRGEASLWEALEGAEAHRDTYLLLHELMQNAQWQTPYEFFTNILGPLRGRQLWQRRMGPEVLDPLDELLNLALSYERDHSPTLQLFLRWIHDNQTELKRDLDQSDEVRIMTVHGSKGLQAPVILLPDTTQIPRDTPPLLWDGNLCVWMPPIEGDIALTSRLRSIHQRGQDEEYRRLLYVALTRAEDQLYICGWKNNSYEIPEGSWYDLAVSGLARCGEEYEFDFIPHLGEQGWSGQGYVLASSQEVVCSQQNLEVVPQDVEKTPAWLHEKLIPDPMPYSPLTPSQLGGEKTVRALAPDSSGFGMKRGQLMHKLLEILPQLPSEKWQQGCEHYLQHQSIPEDMKEKIAADCLRILQDYPHLFTPDSQAEVPIVGLVGHFSLSGQIDRLVVGEQQVHVIDYKTNVVAPTELSQIPEAYIRQMGAYKAALQPLYPNHEILCSLLWTTLPRLDTIPHDLLQPYLEDPSAEALVA